MKQLVWVTLGVTLFFVTATAKAETAVKYPETAPAIEVMFPDGWAVDKDEDGSLSVVSKDEEIEFDIWALEDIADPQKMIEQLKDTGEEVHGYIADYVADFEVTEHNRGTVNGLNVASYSGEGKDKEDGEEVEVGVTFLSPDNKQVIVIMYWGSEDAEEKHKSDLVKINQSLKKAQ